MGKNGRQIDRQRRRDRIWFAAIAPIMSLLFFPLFPFPLSPQFLSIDTANADSAAVSTATAEGRLAVFDDVWQTINSRYYDANFHGVDWWAQRAQFRSLAADARDPEELYAVLRRLLASLRDAHTRIYAPEQKFDWEHPRFVTIGLSLREIEGQLTVVSVERGSEAERNGIRAGDVVQAINGNNALLILERKLSEQIGSSTTQAARLFALSSLADGPAGTTVAIQWFGADYKLRRTTLRRHWQQRALGVHIKRHDGIAVVTIDAFTKALAADFALASNGLRRQVRGVVLDLRNNGGGDAEVMAEMASAFLPPVTGLGQFTDRNGNVSLKLETGVTPLLIHIQNNPIETPIVILTSERTSSAAEIFIAALKTTNVTVLGVQTCGCVLAVRTQHALPDGGELEVSELDFHTSTGVRLEGAGIKPDEVIRLTRRDIYAKRDPALKAAFAKLKSYPRH